VKERKGKERKGKECVSEHEETKNDPLSARALQEQNQVPSPFAWSHTTFDNIMVEKEQLPSSGVRFIDLAGNFDLTVASPQQVYLAVTSPGVVERSDLSLRRLWSLTALTNTIASLVGVSSKACIQLRGLSHDAIINNFSLAQWKAALIKCDDDYYKNLGGGKLAETLVMIHQVLKEDDAEVSINSSDVIDILVWLESTILDAIGALEG